MGCGAPSLYLQWSLFLPSGKAGTEDPGSVLYLCSETQLSSLIGLVAGQLCSGRARSLCTSSPVIQEVKPRAPGLFLPQDLGHGDQQRFSPSLLGDQPVPCHWELTAGSVKAAALQEPQHKQIAFRQPPHVGCPLAAAWAVAALSSAVQVVLGTIGALLCVPKLQKGRCLFFQGMLYFLDHGTNT